MPETPETPFEQQMRAVREGFEKMSPTQQEDLLTASVEHMCSLDDTQFSVELTQMAAGMAVSVKQGAGDPQLGFVCRILLEAAKRIHP